ncbi:MAG: hypothetical protein E4G98_00275 [Promethearchaeota archaeon]|nr:MAG: hypothetical protein E4G98_00275 [Candidatus Lokiarchaeota archaeon]
MNTPFLDEIYQRVDFDRELVFKFFIVFSLFEYSLKRGGFLTRGQSGEAQPDWKGFANSIHPQFDPQATPEMGTAVNYMLNRPVMKQIPSNNNLVYTQRQRPQNMNDTEWLSVLIRGVRNNLFHGGKFRYARPRDPDLITNSLVVLETWAQLQPDVERELRNAEQP